MLSLFFFLFFFFFLVGWLAPGVFILSKQGVSPVQKKKSDTRSEGESDI